MAPNPSTSPPLALSMGEPAGIGPEITLHAWLARGPERLKPFFVAGDPSLYRDLASALRLDVPVREIAHPAEATEAFTMALPVIPVALSETVEPGHLSPANGHAVISAIRMACDYVMAGDAAGLVTNPIHKRALYDAGFDQPGHTEFLAARTGGNTPVMMLSCPGLRVVPVTVHLPLADAVSALTTEMIVEQGRILAAALKQDFAIPSPRLAVAGLNPHAGEEGRLGTEEREIIAPAVQELAREGIEVSGPAPADTLFHAAARSRYDAVLCMYHDQALIPLKTIDFERGVNTTLGLPIVRTSPDHGTALDIAGKGLAHAGSLIEAIRLAGQIAANRAQTRPAR